MANLCGTKARSFVNIRSKGEQSVQNTDSIYSNLIRGKHWRADLAVLIQHENFHS